jgi:hypothetical protein
MRTDRWREARGFSVSDVATSLLALTVLTGAAAPAIDHYVEQAKLVKARHDVRTLAVSVVRLFSDLGPERHIRRGWANYYGAYVFYKQEGLDEFAIYIDRHTSH